MPATLRHLLHASQFQLHADDEIAPTTLDAPLLWAHSSDLPDPTPWIEPGGLLLTDGAQFAAPRTTPVDHYVTRLVEKGIVALGFATGIVHEAIPLDVVAAARACDLPLIEVPRGTPFMGIIRFVSDAIAEDTRRMLESSLRAQRSVARAASKPDGLAAILQELERNLDTWVALFDASGSRVRVATTREIPPALSAEVEAAVDSTLTRGRSAAVRLSLAGTGEVTLQTLGQQGALRGILAVGTGAATLDRVGADLVDAVIALASIALEQSRTLDDARRRLRTGVLELLIAGMTAVAARTVEPVWGPLPAAPLCVGSVELAAGAEPGAAQSLRSALEMRAVERERSLFFAEQGDVIVVIAPADESDEMHALLRGHDARAGFSNTAAWTGLSGALGEARRALALASAGRPVIDFDDLAQAGLLGHLQQTNAHDLAQRILQPLSAPNAPRELRRTLEVWLENNGAWDPASKALGIHRHTLRHRVDAAGALLDLDLDTFAGRAELWGALQLTQP